MCDIRVKKPRLSKSSRREARLVFARAIFAHDHGRRGDSITSGLWNTEIEPRILDVVRSSPEFVESWTTGLAARWSARFSNELLRTSENDSDAREFEEV